MRHPPYIDTAYLGQTHGVVDVSFWFGPYKTFIDLQLDGAFGSVAKHTPAERCATYLTTVYREYVCPHPHRDDKKRWLGRDLEACLGYVKHLHRDHLVHPNLMAAHYVQHSLISDGLVSLGGWGHFSAHGEPPGYLESLHVDCSKVGPNGLPTVTYHGGSFIPS